VKIDRLDHCIQTEAGPGLVFKMQTHFAIHPTDSYTCRITSDRQRWFDADRIGLISADRQAVLDLINSL
jgi:hypothetical protein